MQAAPVQHNVITVKNMELNYINKQGRLQNSSNEEVHQSNPFYWKDKMSPEMEIISSNIGS